jgi:hypothetical protein
MKSFSLNSRKIETLFYVVIWALVFSVPYFSDRGSGNINWNEVTINWAHVFGYLVIFLINVYILVPRLLLKKRYKNYFFLVSVLILIVIAVNIIPQSGFPLKGTYEMNPPNNGISSPIINRPMQKPPFMAFADNLIICILIVGAGTTTRLMSKWLSEEKLRKDIEKEQLKTNLALLRHQVSPHFFMNTLNNIHALIDINSENAKDAIVRLSTLMRYLLYDSAQIQINLKKEIEFINSFNSLMQLRYSDKVNITFVVPDQIPDIQIPPMLFISFLENAFKHGISYQSESFIYFKIEILGKFLQCTIKNSKHSTHPLQDGEYSGIGLENIKKSLKLLYNENYKLTISDNENDFKVDLIIPI